MVESKRRLQTWTRRFLLLLAGGVVVAQFLPLGAERSNPPVVAEPPWNAPQTRELFLRTCGDCHSNETRWPWYSRVAPVSWLITSDVRDGRRHLNVSEWNRPQRDAEEAAEEFADGEMPPWFYLPLHSAARLGPIEREQLLAGLGATFGEPEEGGEGRREGRRSEGRNDD